MNWPSISANRVFCQGAKETFRSAKKRSWSESYMVFLVEVIFIISNGEVFLFCLIGGLMIEENVEKTIL